jgi:putative transposase
MTAPYSVDLRERTLARKGTGETKREIAVALRTSPSCVSKWTKRKPETDSLAPAQIGGDKPRTLSGESADWLRARIAAGRSFAPLAMTIAARQSFNASRVALRLEGRGRKLEFTSGRTARRHIPN